MTVRLPKSPRPISDRGAGDGDEQVSAIKSLDLT
jgi:hypothetical protein